MPQNEPLKLSEYSDEELIEEWKLATELDTVGKHLSYVQDLHTSSAWLEVRDEIKRRGLDKQVEDIDKELIKNSIKYGAYGNMEEELHPVEDWWWHLYEIAKGEYPEEKLPEPLRQVYKKHLQQS